MGSETRARLKIVKKLGGLDGKASCRKIQVIYTVNYWYNDGLVKEVREKRKRREEKEREKERKEPSFSTQKCLLLEQTTPSKLKEVVAFLARGLIIIVFYMSFVCISGEMASMVEAKALC